MLKAISRQIRDAGGRVFYVGGYVRDKFIGVESKDIDVEIFGIDYEVLMGILTDYGEIDTIGKSFGIIKVKGLDIDFSMPKARRKTGGANKGLQVSVDPYMSYSEACRRRDFTMNSIMQDVLTGEIIDYYAGRKDIEDRVIRHVDDETFIEDPLRVYRAFQFAGRFGFAIAPETLELCRTIDLSFLPRERVFEEIMKLLMKSDRPSMGFEYMRELGIFKKHFSALDEGSVWNHTMLAVDEAAKLRAKSKHPEALMLAALLHDAGEAASIGILTAITADKRLIDEVRALVKHHMEPMNLYNSHAKAGALRRLANECDVWELLLLYQADHKGEGLSADPAADWFRDMIESNSLDKKLEPLVKGRDLIALGIAPGPKLGEMLDEAYERQMDGYSYEEIMEMIRKQT